MSKIKLGVFCPSSFKDYLFLKNLLNKKSDEISVLISNASGHNLVNQYGQEKNIPYMSYPIGKSCNVLCSNDKIIATSDNVLIIDNGQSSNNEKVIERCRVAEKPYKVIKVGDEEVCRSICEDLKSILEKKKEDETLVEFLADHKQIANKLEKILKKL